MRRHSKDDVTFEDSNSYKMNDPGMYGIESFLIKKHVWLPGHAVVRGALLHDSENGRQYFVTEADLSRYLVPPPKPEIDT